MNEPGGPFEGMAPPSPEMLEALRREVRRKAALASSGAAMLVVGLLLPRSSVPEFPLLPSAVVLLGCMVMLIGSLGWLRGSGCLGQVLGVGLLWALSCQPRGDVTVEFFAIATLAAVAVALVLRGLRRHKGGADARPPFSGPAASGTANGEVIDVTAREV